MNYAEASYDHSKSRNPPSPPLPVYHFSHIAAREDAIRVKGINDECSRLARNRR